MLSPDRKPGDFLLERYFPNADAELRERARVALIAYGRHLRRLGTQLATADRAAGEEPASPTDGMLSEATSSHPPP